MEADSNYGERSPCEFGHASCPLNGLLTLLHSDLSRLFRSFGLAPGLGNIMGRVPSPEKKEDRHHQRQDDGY